MTWKRVKGMSGMLFVPGGGVERKKKHPCPDCYACGWCSDERCQVCLAEQKASHCAAKTPEKVRSPRCGATMRSGR